MSELKIINVDMQNISKYQKGISCFLNPNHESVKTKIKWIKKRFNEGLKIKLLFSEKEKKIIGFIEYIKGENAWRAVDAKKYLIIHCIWVSPNKKKNKGYGSLLVNEVLKDAKKEGKNGVCVITSEGSFMAGKDLFLKNGFKSISYSKPFDLMVKTFEKGNLPKFNDWEKQINKYKGWNLVYSNQCPWVARSIKELGEIADKNKIKLNIIELKNSQQAQNAPSIYATFNLIYNGKIFADHYISQRRFQNIINKEVK